MRSRSDLLSTLALALLLIVLIVGLVGDAYGADVSVPATIQQKLDAGKGNWLPDGRNAVGQIVTLEAKTIKLTKPLVITSAQTLSGKGSATVIQWDGPPGTSAILIKSYLGHQYAKGIALKELCIYTPNGAKAVSIDAASTKWVENFNTENLIVNGGCIDLRGENYHNRIDAEFRELRGPAVRIDGQNNTLRVRVTGEVKPTTQPVALIEVHGSATLEAGSQLETIAPCPQLAGFDWQGWRGSINVVGGVHLEPHSQGTSVLLTNCDYTGPTISGAMPQHPWKLVNSTINTTKPYDRAGVVDDARPEGGR